MRCPYCEQEHPDDSLYCPITGKEIPAPLLKDSPPAKPESASPPGSIGESAAFEPGTGAFRIRQPSRGIVWPIILIATIISLLTLAAFLVISHLNGINHTGANQPVTGHSASPAETGGRIVFVTNRNGNSEIYVMNADGSHPTRLTNTSPKTNNDYPAWSPDGEKIAFVSDRAGNPEIYVMNADGSDPTLLRDIPAGESPLSLYSYNEPGDFRPIWSPDGQKIAFISSLDGGDYKVCIMGADGSSPSCLPDSQVGDFYPGMLLKENKSYPQEDKTGLSWCADGETIVYSSSRSGASRIYAIQTDSGAQSALTMDQDGYAPDCSADGLKIAFVSNWNGRLEIYEMNADGSAKTNLTDEKQSASGSPSWSADGLSIVFQSDRDGNSEIYVMGTDGSHQTRLTENQGQSWHPDWSPTSSPALPAMPAAEPGG